MLQTCRGIQGGPHTKYLNSNSLTIPWARTSACQYSFPNALNEWNKLPEDLTNTNNIVSLKIKMQMKHECDQKLFNVMYKMTEMHVDLSIHVVYTPNIQEKVTYCS